MGMGTVEALGGGATSRGRAGVRGVGEGGAGDHGRAEPSPWAGLSRRELEERRVELEERISQLRRSEESLARSGRWNLRREKKEQRHRAEGRLSEVVFLLRRETCG